MTDPVLLAFAAALAVFAGFPLAHRAADFLVERSDAAWGASSLEWLEQQGGEPPREQTQLNPRISQSIVWMVRVAFAAIAFLIGFRASSPVVACVLTWLCLVAAAAALADIRARILPDLLVGLIGLTGIGLSVAGFGPTPRDSLIGLAVAGVVFWLISRGYAVLRHREGLGLGDVKLFAVTGLFVGWAYLPAVALLAVLATILMILLERTATSSHSFQVPFGPGIVASLLIVLAIVK